MKYISFVIVDDHKLVREMWRAILATDNRFNIVGESGDFEVAIELIKNTRPDVVFLDINLPPYTGMDAVPIIRKYSPGTAIIVVTMHCKMAYAKKMFQLGVKGYVTKNSSSDEVFIAIDEVLKGNKYLCNEVRNQLTEHQELIEHAHGPSLSLRELEIVKLIREGYSSKEIGETLHISVRTAETHRGNILKKLKLKNTASLIKHLENSDLL